MHIFYPADKCILFAIYKCILKNKHFKNTYCILCLIYEFSYYMVIFKGIFLFCNLCLVAQTCPIFSSPLDCSPPGSSVHEILQERILEWAAMLLQGIFLTQGLNPCLLCLLCCRWILYPLSHRGRTKNFLNIPLFSNYHDQ